MIKILKKHFILKRPFVHMYVLDITTIGITKEPVPDWRKICLYHKILRVQVVKGAWLVKLPRRVTRFYRYDRNTQEAISLGMGGRILITVTRK